MIPRNSNIEANQSGLIAEPLIDITPQLPIPEYKVELKLNLQSRLHSLHIMLYILMLQPSLRVQEFCVLHSDTVLKKLNCVCRPVHWNRSVSRKARLSAAKATSRGGQVRYFQQ